MDRMRKGLLCLVLGEVWSFHRGRKVWYRLRGDAHPLSGRRRYKMGRGRWTVYKNRLVWMLITRCPIPCGFVVDHKDGDRTNDLPGNLELMEEGDSRRQGLDRQESKMVRVLGEWFGFMGS